MAGRPRQFSNAAEKQKAYRERLKADEKILEHNQWLANLVQDREQALRNLMMYYHRKNKTAEMFVNDRAEYVNILVGGYAHNTVNYLVAVSLIRRGEFELIRRDWSGGFYRFIQPGGDAS